MPKKILLVDDQDSMRDLFAQLLKDRGYVVDLAEDGEEAWDLVCKKEPPYDLIITDVNMPRLDGFQFLKQIRQANPSAAVLLMTGANEEVAEVVCQEYKANGLIKKPFIVAEALALIEKELGS
ncbi:MAG: response regulator [Candidatus Margulisiibacteriota bacterium]